MMSQEKIEWVANRWLGAAGESDAPRVCDSGELDVMALDRVAAARAFHEGFPQYAMTPLVRLDNLAEHLGVGGVFVKDESFRFGLNAFKVLGGSFAMARYIAEQTGRAVQDVTFDYLTGDELARDFGQATFFTATDGNHGRGVAWAARQLGQKAVVRMPKGSSEHRRAMIAAEGAEVTIEDMNYDDCVRLAAAQAAACERGVVVQDTAWDGYEKIPALIMQGYGTLASEAAEQLEAASAGRPTHVVVQAGVGSLAAAVVGYFCNRYPDNPPTFVIVEASAAACLHKSARAADGAPHAVGGDLRTIMAGLACGEPNTIGWEILRRHAHVFASCPDWVAARGMRVLGAPLTGDPRVISGESGAAGAGFLVSVARDEAYAPLREAIGLDERSTVLLISTEGDTDPAMYRRVVWDGAWPAE